MGLEAMDRNPIIQACASATGNHDQYAPNAVNGLTVAIQFDTRLLGAYGRVLVPVDALTRLPDVA